MGLFKKIKKSVKKAIKNPIKTVQAVAKGDVKGALKSVVDTAVDPVKDSVGIAKAAGNEIGNGLTALKNAVSPSAPTIANAADAGTVAASDVATPEKEEAEGDTDGDSASEIKKNRATGKKSLTVARNSGGGINV